MKNREKEHLFRCMDKMPKVILLPVLMICLDHFETAMNGDISDDKNVMKWGENAFEKTKHIIEEFSNVAENDSEAIAKKLAKLIVGE